MNGETQANRLAQLMQKNGHLPTYELTLPSVLVRHTQIKKLLVDDILLLGQNSLVSTLLVNNKICANMILTKHNNRHTLQIVKMQETPIKTTDSKKYGRIKLLLGTVQSRSLDVGHMIDIAQVNFEKVTLMHKEKKIATGTLINVDNEIAVKIVRIK